MNLFALNPSDPFPPLNWTAVYDHYNMLAAWYSGSGQKLADYYSAALSSGTTADARLRFWSRITRQERANFVHVPVFNDIAAMSSSLLFSERPIIEADEEAGDATATLGRLEEIFDENGALRVFAEAAESCAALGGVFLKIGVNRDIAAMPLISINHADAAFPSFRHGRLYSVTFWDVEEELTNGDIIRVFETYEPGKVTTVRFRAGAGTVWGSPVGEAETVETGIPGLACVYVPNLRPHPLFRGGAGLHLGRADCHALDSLMDSLDEIYTDWLRDIQLAKGRIIGSEAFFEKDSESGSFMFNVDRQAYMGLPNVIGNEAAGLKDQLVVSQFDIRADEHEKSYINTLRTIYSMAGYAPTSFGIDAGGVAESGRALKTRDRRTFITRNNKATYWEPALEEFIGLLLEVDNAQKFSSVPVVPFNVTLSDSVDNDAMDVAGAVELLNRAGAASVETKVRLANPGRAHDNDWVAQEVQRIMEETGRGLPTEMEVGLV